MEISDSRFQWPDYLVFALSMLISAAIGIYHAFRSRNRSNVDEYLMGSRDMGILPVAASLVVSIVSAVSVLGFPSEMYAFGVLVMTFNLGYGLALLVAGLFYLPVYHRLKVTSMYEYLEKRFDQRVRTTCFVLSMIVMVLYASIALYAPSLAISQVTGMSYWMCILLSGILSTFYTVLGGFRTVLWTDTVQSAIMILGLVITFAKGTVDAGGIANVMNVSTYGGRMDIGKMEPDIFERYNFWTWLIGDFPFMLALYATMQVSVQRFCSITSINRARLSLVAAIPIFTVILTVAMLCGLVAFAYYYGCDPLASGRMDRRDQTLPIFVMDVFRGWSGMPGLFLSSVLSAALSTLSSVQHSLAAVILEDALLPIKRKYTNKGFSDHVGTILTKFIVVLVSAVIVACAIGVANLSKTVLQLGVSSLALSMGPSLGIYTMGIFVPFYNAWGAQVGMLSAFGVLLWVNVGAMTVRVQHAPLPVFTHLCPFLNQTVVSQLVNVSWPEANQTRLFQAANYSISNFNSTSTGEESGLQLYKLSYRYHIPLAFLVTVVVGSVVSLLTGGWKNRHHLPEGVLFSWSIHGLHFNSEQETKNEIPVDKSEISMMLGNTDKDSEKFPDNANIDKPASETLLVASSSMTR